MLQPYELVILYVQLDYTSTSLLLNVNIRSGHYYEGVSPATGDLSLHRNALALRPSNSSNELLILATWPLRGDCNVYNIFIFYMQTDSYKKQLFRHDIRRRARLPLNEIQTDLLSTEMVDILTAAYVTVGAVQGHHIHPKHEISTLISSGLEINSKENIIYLTVKEHGLAHLLRFMTYGKLEDLYSGLCCFLRQLRVAGQGRRSKAASQFKNIK